MPTSPGRRPAAARIAKSRNVVVVFPFVPVTPATSSSSVGSPKNASAARAIAARTSATTSCGTSSVERPLDDERDGAGRRPPRGAKSCPSACAPGTQKNSAPGETRARVIGEVGDLDRRRATTSTAPSAATRRSRSIIARRVYRRLRGLRARVGRHLEVLRSKPAICAKAGAATMPP